MGPRMGIRGKATIASGKRYRKARCFNGAADGDPRKGRRIYRHRPGLPQLQWGRGWGSAESRWAAGTGLLGVLASMGPRMGIRGKLGGSLQPALQQPASMGPRMGIRGKRNRERRIRAQGMASMGPRMGIRGKLGGSLQPALQQPASMGPRMGIRGKHASAIKWRTGRRRFNGAADGDPRKGVAAHLAEGKGRARFNGAADGDPRKGAQDAGGE